MARHVFLSFVEEDCTRVNLFHGHAKNKNSGLEFDDYSVKGPHNSHDAAYIRSRITERIRAASVTLCLIGAKTSTSPWVKWEIEKSAELGNKVLGVRLHDTPLCPTPSALTALRAPVFRWDIDAIVKAIG